MTEPRMIMFCGRRILCHQDFRFYLSTVLPKPRFSPAIASITTLINFDVSHDTLTEDLLSRLFARIRPDLYQEWVHGLRNLQLLKDTLFHFSHILKSRVLASGRSGQEGLLSSPKSLQFITNLTEARLQVSNVKHICLKAETSRMLSESESHDIILSIGQQCPCLSIANFHLVIGLAFHREKCAPWPILCFDKSTLR